MSTNEFETKNGLAVAIASELSAKQAGDIAFKSTQNAKKLAAFIRGASEKELNEMTVNALLKSASLNERRETLEFVHDAVKKAFHAALESGYLPASFSRETCIVRGVVTIPKLHDAEKMHDVFSTSAIKQRTFWVVSDKLQDRHKHIVFNADKLQELTEKLIPAALIAIEQKNLVAANNLIEQIDQYNELLTGQNRADFANLVVKFDQLVELLKPKTEQVEQVETIEPVTVEQVEQVETIEPITVEQVEAVVEFAQLSELSKAENVEPETIEPTVQVESATVESVEKFAQLSEFSETEMIEPTAQAVPTMVDNTDLIKMLLRGCESFSVDDLTMLQIGLDNLISKKQQATA